MRGFRQEFVLAPCEIGRFLQNWAAQEKRPPNFGQAFLADGRNRFSGSVIRVSHLREHGLTGYQQMASIMWQLRCSVLMEQRIRFDGPFV